MMSVKAVCRGPACRRYSFCPSTALDFCYARTRRSCREGHMRCSCSDWSSKACNQWDACCLLAPFSHQAFVAARRSSQSLSSHVPNVSIDLHARKVKLVRWRAIILIDGWLISVYFVRVSLATTYVVEATQEGFLDVRAAHVVVAGDGDKRDGVAKLLFWDDSAVD